MYIYGFYNFDYDDTTYIKLGHNQQFTKEGFENIVNECRRKTEEQLQINRTRINNIEDCESITEEEFDALDNLSCESQVIENILKMLISQYGFLELKPVYTFTFTDGEYWIPPTVINKCK